MNKRIFKVVLIDDEPLVLEGLIHLIDWQSQGFSIAGVFDDVEKALDEMESIRPNLLITDINMPVINGLELTRRLKDSFPDLIVCIQSGYKDFKYAKEALNLEVFDYLVKPLFDDDLIPVVVKAYDTLLKKENRKELLQVGFDELVKGIFDNIYENSTLVINEWYNKSGYTYETNNLWRYILWDCSDYNIDIDIFIKDSFDAFCISDYVILESNQIVVNDRRLDIINRMTNYAQDHEGVRLYISDAYLLENLHESYIEVKTLKQLVMKDSQHKIITSDLRCCSKGIKVKDVNQSLFLKMINEKNLKGYTEAVNSKLSYLFYSSKTLKEVYDEIIGLRQHIDYAYNQLLKDLGYESMSRHAILDEESFNMNIVKTLFIDDYDLYTDYLVKNDRKQGKDILGEVEKYIDLHFAESISLKSIAANYYIHPNYLGQKLKKAWGVSFNTYLNRRRVQEGVKLLEESDYSIQEISEMTGYKNYTSFLEYFRKYMSMTPADYKKTKN